VKRGTQIRRKVLAVVSHGETRRGNPEGFWYFQECGHVNYRYFTVSESMNVFMLKVGKAPEVRCSKCSTGRMEVKEIDLKLVRVFSTEVQILQREIKKYRESLKSLLESAPIEFERDFEGVSAYKYRHLKVVKEHTATGDGWEDFRENPWPGPHKNVYNWWELEDGHAVGWNENPSRGWSFPVVKLKVGEPT